MNHTKKKFFWKYDSDKRYVVALPWNAAEDYAVSTKKCADEGLHQITVTTNMMLGLISDIAGSAEWEICHIEMMDDEEELDDDLNGLIDRSIENKGLLLELYNVLVAYSEESALAIKKLCFRRDRRMNERYSEIHLYVTGLVGFLGHSADNAESMLTGYFEGYYNR